MVSLVSSQQFRKRCALSTWKQMKQLVYQNGTFVPRLLETACRPLITQIAKWNFSSTQKALLIQNLKFLPQILQMQIQKIMAKPTIMICFYPPWFCVTMDYSLLNRWAFAHDHPSQVWQWLSHPRHRRAMLRVLCGSDTERLAAGDRALFRQLTWEFCGDVLLVVSGSHHFGSARRDK